MTTPTKLLSEMGTGSLFQFVSGGCVYERLREKDIVYPASSSIEAAYKMWKFFEWEPHPVRTSDLIHHCADVPVFPYPTGFLKGG